MQNTIHHRLSASLYHAGQKALLRHQDGMAERGLVAKPRRESDPGDTNGGKTEPTLLMVFWHLQAGRTMYTCTHLHSHTETLTYMDTHTHAHSCIYTQTHTCTYMHTYSQTHSHMHAHTHIDTQSCASTITHTHACRHTVKFNICYKRKVSSRC